MQNHSLTEGKIGPALVRFAIPFLFASMLQSLYGAADMFVVGQFSGAAAVSGVSTGSQVLNTITNAVLGFCTGGTVLVAQQMGRKDGDGTARAIGTLAVAFAAIGLILTPLMLRFTPQMAELMQTPAEAFEEACRYIRIPMSWALSRIPGASLFYIGLAAPAASLLQVVICVAYFLWLRKKGKLYA